MTSFAFASFASTTLGTAIVTVAKMKPTNFKPLRSAIVFPRRIERAHYRHQSFKMR